MKLYEIEEKFKYLEILMDRWAAEHDGDLTEFPFDDEMEDIAEAKNEKLVNIACWIKNLRAEEAMLKSEEQALKSRREKAANKAESLENLIKKYMPVSMKISAPRAMLSYRRSEKVNIINESKLPKKYFKTVKTPILSDIKKDIAKLSGVAEIKESWNLQIK